MNLNHHNYVLYTNEMLDKCKSAHAFSDHLMHEWTMWIGEDVFPNHKQLRIELVPVINDSDYEEMFNVRKKVEILFGCNDDNIIKSFVEDIRNMVDTYKGRWFLAKYQGQVIGEIGLVPFEFNGLKAGRLKDVDILSEFRKKGFGNELLSAICIEAQNQNLNALCLTANAEDWPKEWYLRFGFKKVGVIDRTSKESNK